MYPYFKYVSIPGLDTIQKELDIPTLLKISEETLRVDKMAPLIKFKGGVFKLELLALTSVLNASPTLKNYLNDSGLHAYLRFSVLISTQSTLKNKTKVHIDQISNNCLNIPIYNCDMGITEFFDDLKDPSDTNYEINTILDSKKVSYQYSTNASNPIATAKVSTPHWINTGIPHRAVNNSEETRYTISLRFDKEWDTTLHEKTRLIDD